MNNKELLEYINNYETEQGFDVSDDADGFLETLQDSGKEIYTEVYECHRWWDDVFCVVQLGYKQIGHTIAHTTGDTSPRDSGWEFDTDSICEVEPRYETVERYYRVST
tara:strand:- start:166 stop:489 length:324 start_codon:yes stop_codon:yes gene_type:complete